MSQTLRPPAVPLVTTDPFLSVWSASDRLYDLDTKHWTGRTHALTGLLVVDGQAWRFAGSGEVRTDEVVSNWYKDVVPLPGARVMEQTGLAVEALSSTYTFAGGGVRLAVEFTAPLLPDDLDVLARPAGYVTFRVSATDGRAHDVKVYFDITGEWAVNTPEQEVQWHRSRLADGSHLLRIGTVRQRVLKKKGDKVRIDWGYACLAVPDGPGVQAVIRPAAVRAELVRTGQIAGPDDAGPARPVEEDAPVLACLIPLGTVAAAEVQRFVVIAYDDLRSVEYFGAQLPGYWSRNGLSFENMLMAAVREHAPLLDRCARFSSQLRADAAAAGGDKYADIAALAYRQAVAAHKLVADPDGNVLFFSKENNSNGCMATVDVTYPSAPLFLLYNPELLKGMLRPVLKYAASPAWPYPFAPHDVGRYPIANGQAYGLEPERQMPVEECGNLLILLAALCRVEGNAGLAAEHWDLVRTWAHYLREHGLDPDNQLCTDDFAGHLAHNTNLSIKAIMALAGYALLCQATGRADEAAEFRQAAREMAARWEEMARDGDHYKLTFDRPGTWSMKYNLVWDRLLGLDLFQPEVAQLEVAQYLKKRNRYGTPLDSRTTYTKADWLVWVATLADRPEDFAALVEPLWDFLNETRTRHAFTDWYYTVDGRIVAFIARSVVGGVFIKMLQDRWVR